MPVIGHVQTHTQTHEKLLIRTLCRLRSNDASQAIAHFNQTQETRQRFTGERQRFGLIAFYLIYLAFNCHDTWAAPLIELNHFCLLGLRSWGFRPCFVDPFWHSCHTLLQRLRQIAIELAHHSLPTVLGGR